MKCMAYTRRMNVQDMYSFYIDIIQAHHSMMITSGKTSTNCAGVVF